MTKIINELKKRGYMAKKDVHGCYFDKGRYRLTVTQTGPIYNCFYNELINGEFRLRDRKLNLLNTEFCYQWIMLHLN